MDLPMKAIACSEYGSADVLKLVEVATPLPRPREVLVRIHASTVSAEDPKLRAFDHPPLHRPAVALIFGYPRPRRGIWGMEFAGEVVARGEGVTRFQVGDRVFGYTGLGLGAHAEYRCLPETGVLAQMPSNLSYAEAAAIPNGALTALVYLRNLAAIQPGERVLVYGASGSVGTAAVQLAKAFGAHVTGVCSTRNLELVLSLGADEVIDYTARDFRESGPYDIFFDTIGRTALRDVKSSLAPRGRYLVTVFDFLDTLRMLWTWLRRGQRIIGGASNFHWRAEQLELLCDLIEAGRFKPVIDRSYLLHEAAEAHRYVEEGHKRGNVVLLVRRPNEPTRGFSGERS
jgi:NADPH:quinone reductase-like Zn-dependent oxidoreductase